jgi:hypothetical protein
MARFDSIALRSFSTGTATITDQGIEGCQAAANAGGFTETCRRCQAKPLAALNTGDCSARIALD